MMIYGRWKTVDDFYDSWSDAYETFVLGIYYCVAKQGEECVMENNFSQPPPFLFKLRNVFC